MVVVIILILAALLSPAMKKALELGRRATCSSNTHQVTVGLAMYANDHEGFLPRSQRGQNAALSFEAANPLEGVQYQVQDGNTGYYQFGNADNPLAVFSDIFHTGGPASWWGPPGYPHDYLWPHTQDPVGLNVAFTDGHVEFMARPHMLDWVIEAFQIDGAGDRFVSRYWEWLEGSTDRLQQTYSLP